jgi:hypothetical protein
MIPLVFEVSNSLLKMLTATFVVYTWRSTPKEVAYDQTYSWTVLAFSGSDAFYLEDDSIILLLSLSLNFVIH